MTIITVADIGGFGDTTYTYDDMIEKVYRRVMSGQREAFVQINNGGVVTDTVETFGISGSSAASVAPGNILSVDFEMMYVLAFDQTNSIVTVERGYRGSRAAVHDDSTVCYVNPKYPKYDIGVAINDELRSLSSPTNGLGRIGSALITYNPVFQAYDLGDLPYGFIDILEINYKTPFPDRRPRPIHKWRIVRNADTGYFPSGQSIVINEGGFPGQPIEIVYKAPYIPLMTSTDDPTFTPGANESSAVRPYNGYGPVGTCVPNLSDTALDIPVLGAMIQLTIPREIARNFMESQPDPRKATEVPSLAISNSVQAMQILKERRISEESDRQARLYPHRRAW